MRAVENLQTKFLWIFDPLKNLKISTLERLVSI
jgi:hypothetical protein